MAAWPADRSSIIVWTARPEVDFKSFIVNLAGEKTGERMQCGMDDWLIDLCCDVAGWDLNLEFLWAFVRMENPK